MFVDEVEIEVIAGSGGNGCMAFRREKYVPMGGPYGGNGGRGQDIYFQTDTGLSTLLDFRYNKKIIGKNGENGKGKNQNGEDQEDLIIKVPVGTIVTDIDTGMIVCDLNKKNQKEIIAKGGRGGFGNTHFKTQSNTAPHYAENGQEGEHRHLKIELKLLADVCLVGLPSVGKSTIVSKISKATPKIADYHFTTLHPILGVALSSSGKSFVVADMPGLIKDAYKGVGLGDKFLKHIQRCSILVHVVDMSQIEGRNAVDDFNVIQKELELYDKNLLKKPMIVLANKMDMPQSKDNLVEFKKHVKLKIFETSGINSSGLQEVVDYLSELLEKVEKVDLVSDDMQENHILYKFIEEKPFTIRKNNDEWIVEGKKIDEIFKMTNFQTEEAALRFSKKMSKLGIDDELRRLGAKSGDYVKISNFYFKYQDE